MEVFEGRPESCEGRLEKNVPYMICWTAWGFLSSGRTMRR